METLCDRQESKQKAKWIKPVLWMLFKNSQMDSTVSHFPSGDLPKLVIQPDVGTQFQPSLMHNSNVPLFSLFLFRLVGKVLIRSRRIVCCSLLYSAQKTVGRSMPMAGAGLTQKDYKRNQTTVFICLVFHMNTWIDQKHGWVWCVFATCIFVK